MKRALQIGTAGWAATWVPFYQKSGVWELAGVVSRSADSLGRFLKEKQLKARGYTELSEALKDDYDVVVISAPHQVHVPLAIEALRAGKNVLIEKPLSNSLDSAKELTAVAKTCPGIVMVSQNFRFREPLWQAKGAVDTGLGAITALRVEMLQEYNEGLLNVAKKNRISSLIEEVFIHQADQARFLLNARPVKVYAEAWSDAWDCSGQANNADVLVEFEHGKRLNYHGSWSTQGIRTSWAGSWRIHGERGTIDWDGSDQGGLTLHASKGATLELPKQSGFTAFDRAGILQEFSDALDQNRTPMCSLADNLWSFGMVAAALLSLEKKRPILLTELLE